MSALEVTVGDSILIINNMSGQLTPKCSTTNRHTYKQVMFSHLTSDMVTPEVDWIFLMVLMLVPSFRLSSFVRQLFFCLSNQDLMNTCMIYSSYHCGNLFICILVYLVLLLAFFAPLLIGSLASSNEALWDSVDSVDYKK